MAYEIGTVLTGGQTGGPYELSGVGLGFFTHAVADIIDSSSPDWIPPHTAEQVYQTILRDDFVAPALNVISPPINGFNAGVIAEANIAVDFNNPTPDIDFLAIVVAGSTALKHVQLRIEGGGGANNGKISILDVTGAVIDTSSSSVISAATNHKVQLLVELAHSGNAVVKVDGTEVLNVTGEDFAVGTPIDIRFGLYGKVTGATAVSLIHNGAFMGHGATGVGDFSAGLTEFLAGQTDHNTSTSDDSSTNISGTWNDVAQTPTGPQRISLTSGEGYKTCGVADSNQFPLDDSRVTNIIRAMFNVFRSGSNNSQGTYGKNVGGTFTTANTATLASNVNGGVVLDAGSALCPTAAQLAVLGHKHISGFGGSFLVEAWAIALHERAVAGGATRLVNAGTLPGRKVGRILA